MFKRNPFLKTSEYNPSHINANNTNPFERRVTVKYPSFAMPSCMRDHPEVPCSLMRVTPYSVSIDSENLRHYLGKPDDLLHDLRKALIESDEMKSGQSNSWSWRQKPMLSYHVHLGMLLPTEKSPWIKERKGDTYLTVVASDPTVCLPENSTVGVRYYISFEEHERLMSESQIDIYNIVREQVERGVSAGVEKAVTQQVKTLEQVQTERERLEAQLAELKATEARMIETERRQQERDERLQQRQAEKTAQRQTRNRAGYVYVARGEYGGQVAYKIGRSVNPKSRAKTFGVELPFSVEFVALIQSEDMYALESELHRHYDQQGKWLAGEWFNLEVNDIEYIKSLDNQAK